MNQDTASAVAELRKIPGIGEEIANALIAIGLDTPELVYAAPDYQLESVSGLSKRKIALIRAHAQGSEVEIDVEKAKREGFVCNVVKDIDGNESFDGDEDAPVFIGYPNAPGVITEWAGVKLNHLGFDAETNCNVYARVK